MVLEREPKIHPGETLATSATVFLGDPYAASYLIEERSGVVKKGKLVDIDCNNSGCKVTLQNEEGTTVAPINGNGLQMEQELQRGLGGDAVGVQTLVSGELFALSVNTPDPLAA